MSDEDTQDPTEPTPESDADAELEGEIGEPDADPAPAPEASSPEPEAPPEDAPSDDANDLGDLTDALLAQVHAAVSDVNAGVEFEEAAAEAAATSETPASSEFPAPGQAIPDPPPGSSPMDLPSFGGEPARRMPSELDLLADVNLNVKIELGRTRLLVDDVLRLGEGAVVELDKLAGDPVDIYVNNRHIARGEVLVLNDNFCVRVNEIVEPDAKNVG